MVARGRIVSVGNSAGPVQRSIENDLPGHLLFVVSAGPSGSRATLEGEILPNLPAGYQPSFEMLEITDPENITQTYGEVRGRIQEWVSRNELRRENVDVDFTGGTKVMSVVLGLVAVEEGVDTVYIGGPREGGIVITGQEEVVPLPNPYREFAVRELADAEMLLNDSHADAAAQILASGHRNCAEVHRATLGAYQALAECLAAADLFQFSGKLGAPRRFRDSRESLQEVLSDDLFGQVASLNLHWEKVRPQVATSTNKGEPAGWETMVEILANAERRARQARYDDAVGRLYRAVELRGQQLLTEAYGGRVGEVPAKGLVDNERKRFSVSEFRLSNGTYVIRGLRNLYQALDFSECEKYPSVARAFDELDVHLRSRNESYMAHGLVPITKDNFDDFWKKTLSFLEVGESDLPRWPTIRLAL